MSRVGRVRRETTETRVEVMLNLDGSGELAIETGVPFFNHMLHQLGRHGRLDLRVESRGDLDVDAHHTVEDTGLALGEAFREALGDGRGIARFASQHVPMDDALVLAALDVSGRPYLDFRLQPGAATLGTFPADLVEEFFRAFVTRAGLTLHLTQLHGRSPHHLIEAAFKAAGLVLHRATRIVSDDIPSTKGTL